MEDMLHKLGILGTTNLMYLPKDTVTVNEDNYQLNLQAIEELNELEDVDAVYHNMIK